MMSEYTGRVGRGNDLYAGYYDPRMDPISPAFDIRTWFPEEDVDLDSLEFTDAVGSEE